MADAARAYVTANVPGGCPDGRDPVEVLLEDHRRLKRGLHAVALVWYAMALFTSGLLLGAWLMYHGYFPPPGKHHHPPADNPYAVDASPLALGGQPDCRNPGGQYHGVQGTNKSDYRLCRGGN